MIELRDYQQELYNGVKQAMREGYKRPLVQAPCGAGKSYIFAKMAQSCKGDVLILTHRRELLTQTQKILTENNISNARISMVLTESNRLGKYPKPTMIITDEAHLSRSNSWVNVLNYYDTYTVGFTATPCRLDGKPLGDIYDTLVQGVTVPWLIEHGYLSPYEYYAPMTVNTDNITVRAGDYAVNEIESLMTDKAIYSNILESWKRLAENEKTIAYCVSVKHAKEVAQMFNDAGYPAVEINGGTPEKQREQIMADFRAGKYRVLCNCNVIAEGISINDVTCCLLLRPTESLRLFWQQAQRCMRYAPGKTAKILDCVGNYTRNPLFDMEVEWSLTQSARKKAEFNSEGDFNIRTCPKCYKVFKTANICPYCGTEYPLSPREIKAHEDIELQKITKEEAEKAEQIRKQARREQGRAKSFEELLKIGKAKGYKNPAYWRQMVMRGRKH